MSQLYFLSESSRREWTARWRVDEPRYRPPGHSKHLIFMKLANHQIVIGQSGAVRGGRLQRRKTACEHPGGSVPVTALSQDTPLRAGRMPDDMSAKA